jgi:peptide methionine sulfoxide reductase MsrB
MDRRESLTKTETKNEIKKEWPPRKNPLKSNGTFMCWKCDELLPISQRKDDGSCGDC